MPQPDGFPSYVLVQVRPGGSGFNSGKMIPWQDSSYAFGGDADGNYALAWQNQINPVQGVQTGQNNYAIKLSGGKETLSITFTPILGANVAPTGIPGTLSIVDSVSGQVVGSYTGVADVGPGFHNFGNSLRDFADSATATYYGGSPELTGDMIPVTQTTFNLYGQTDDSIPEPSGLLWLALVFVLLRRRDRRRRRATIR
jgi:MYXO-CTERM domain-containing protein